MSGGEIESSGLQFALEPRGYDFGQVIDYDLVVNGEVAGRVWAQDGAWTATLDSVASMTFPGQDAQQAGYWAASWLTRDPDAPLRIDLG